MALVLASRPHSGGIGRLFRALFVIAFFARAVWPQSTPQDPDYTCSADKPCAVGCCDKFGICGMGPDFCSPENCVNSCDAKSECDPAGWGPQYALSESCPLNVCCSQFGFCGTTAEFCGDEVVPNPSCSGNSAEKRTIAYYEGWSVTRSCDVMTPESIPWGAYTHINFAFATIDPNSFVVVPADPNDQDLYYRLTNLKSLVPGLQVWLSIGGWSMNDPDQPTATTFSDLAASPAAQEAFAQSLIQLMTTFGFDGVDIDWEYPVAPERSGRPEDFDNYPRWLSNLRSAFSASGHNFGLSITLPSSFWYLQNFDIVKLEPIVDWFNMMEYDLHGTWDSTDVWIGAFVNAHTNLTEIDQSLKLLWRNNIDPSKVVLGLGFYGRSFALQNPSCTAPGCPFSGGAPAGPCTDSVGTLSFVEIEDIIAGGATVTLDEAAAVKIVTYDGNWVSYDDASTLQKKVEYANSICLGGTMVWAVSLDDSKGTASAALVGAGSQSSPKSSDVLLAEALSVCTWSGCVAPGSPTCPAGQTAAFSTTDGCGISDSDIAQAGSDAGFPKRHFCCPSNQVAQCIEQSPDPASHSCNTPSCPSGYASVLTTKHFTAQPECPNVDVNWCCTAPNLITPRDLGCFWTDCGTSLTASCPSGTTELVSVTLGQDGVPTCLNGEHKSLCCPAPLAYDKSTCSFNEGHTLRTVCVSGCPTGKVEVARDLGRSKSCIIGFSSFCCDPPSDSQRSISQALADFEKDVSTFLSGDTCNLGADLDALSRRQISGSNSQITTYYMAQKLVTLLYSWDFDSFEIKYIQPYRDIWERIRNQLGSNVPSWDSLASFVARVGDAVDTIAVLAKQLCPTLSTETDKPDIPDCSPETCGGVSCPVSQSRLTERAMADVPRDIMPQNFDTTGVQRSIDFTAPGTFPAGQTAWWMQVKNLDWWQGSNHGVLPGPPPQPPIASSRYLDLIANPGQNVFTGAGPVYGCTVVAVVSNLGAWTGHFWERFFRHDDLFDPNVLQFLNNGNPAEGYDSLAQYLNPSGPFDRRNPLVEFVRIFIMTPLGWTTGDDATTRRPPSIINLPTIRFPDQINQIISRLDDLFTTSLGQNTIGILTVQPYYYDPGVLQWTLVRTVPTPKWRAEINRSPRRDQNPWLGMLTIQRRALNSQTVPPAIRVYIENRVVFEQTYFADTMP